MNNIELQPFIDRWVVLDKAKEGVIDVAEKTYNEGAWQVMVDILKARYPEYNVRTEERADDKIVAWDANEEQSEELAEFLDNFREKCFEASGSGWNPISIKDIMR